MKAVFATASILVSVLCSTGASADPAQEILDHVEFGDRASEDAHQFESQHSEVLEPTEGEAPDFRHIVSVAATDGVNTTPQETLTQSGEWAVHNEGEWIEYELSQQTEINEVQMEWGRNDTFFFEIHASSDGASWQRVFEGESWNRGSGEFESYEFDSVQAQHIRIVALGRDTRWRQGRFFLSQVRIGDLEHPNAYETAMKERTGLDQSARRLLPVEDEWEGGWMRFVMESAPEEKNYLTVKLWGSDNRLSHLYLRDQEGRWVIATPESMRRGGDNASWTPVWEFAGGTPGGPFPGRFIYVTYPIPREMTEGRSNVTLHLQAAGESFGDPMDVPSQGIYAAYTHTEPFSGFAEQEPQGEPFEWGPPRPAPKDASLEEKLKDEARELIDELVSGSGLSTDNYRGLEALTQAYHAQWSEYYHDEEIVRLVRDTIDAFIRDQEEQGEGPAGPGGWHEHGNLAHAFVQVSGAFKEMGLLGETFEAEGEGGAHGFRYATRRDRYARFFHDALEWRRSQDDGARRRVANQVISVDRAIYRMNQALQKLAPELSMPEEQALRYLYESAGMEPFFSAWPRHEWVRPVAKADYPFHVVSYKGNAREVGLGTSYGDGAPSRFARLADEIDDEKFTERARDLARARATMTRRPSNDGVGNAVLRAPVTFGWRGRSAAYPGRIRYTSAPFLQAAALEDPISLRLAELYIEHGRAFSEGPPRVNQIVPRVEAYRKVKEHLPTEHRLPMEPDSEDFAWADEDLGVFAAKHGDTMISGSFFLDKGGITPYGRIHYTTPEIERIATIKVDVEVKAAAHTYTIDDGLPGGRENVLGGRQRKAAAPPPGLIDRPEGPSPPQFTREISEAGTDQWMGSDERSSMADLYQVEFGDYLIAMNTTTGNTYREQTFTIDAPPDATQALDLVSGEMLDPSEPLELGPRSTVVLYLDQ